MLAGAGSVALGAVGATGTASAQDAQTTETGADAGTTGDPGPDDEAQIRTRAVIPRVGQPFEGNYVGQFLIFTDPTPNDSVSPQVVGECDYADWAPEATRGYQGLLIDRLTDDPQGVEVPMYTNGNEPRVDVGTTFIVDGLHPCGDEFVGLGLESAPVSRFQPDYSTADNPLVGESPGPTVEGDGAEGGDGETPAPGMPGFGAVATAVGVGAAALLGKLRGRE